MTNARPLPPYPPCAQHRYSSSTPATILNLIPRLTRPGLRLLLQTMSSTSLPTSTLPDLPDERNTAPARSSGDSTPPPSRAVPSTYGSSIASWWSHDNKTEIKIAEERLLRRLPSFIPDALTPDPTPTPSNPHPMVARTFETLLPIASSPSSASSSWFGKGKQTQDYLHGVSFYTAGQGGTKDGENKSVNVLLHGYGAGLGFFFLNLQSFAEASAQNGRRAFALDWLGMGLSSRPSPKAFDPPPKTSLPESVSARVKRAEDFFVDSLEAWREKGGYEKMTLIGHSLGGYLSAAYTLKYPSRVDRLILISPVGIPPNPSDPSPSPSDPTTDQDQTDAAPAPAVLASEELTQSREETKGKNGAQSKEGKKVKEDEAEQGKKATASRPRLRAAFGWAWEQGFSPFGVLRALGPLAPKLVGTYASRRFEGLGPDDVRDMHSYIYSTSIAKGSGEFCISHLLAPGAYARLPLCDRMSAITVPTRFLYGSKDWMDPLGGHMAVENMKKAGNDRSKVSIVNEAGHHVYLDNPERMNEIFFEELAPRSSSSRR